MTPHNSVNRASRFLLSTLDLKQIARCLAHSLSKIEHRGQPCEALVSSENVEKIEQDDDDGDRNTEQPQQSSAHVLSSPRWTR
jgi:hypothetical protein